MRDITRRGALGAFAGAAAIGAAPGIPHAQAPAPVRIGWIPTTPVQAQIAHTLDRTDLLARNGLAGTATLFNSSPAVNEGLVSGAVDVGFVSDFAAVTIFAAGAPVVAIGHQSTFRGAVMAAAHTDMRSLADLRGRQVFGLFGVTVFQSAQNMVRRAGLTPGRDVTFVNIGFAELADALRARRVDAFFTWDPWIAFFEKQGLARTLGADNDPAMLILARRAFAEEQSGNAERFLRAHKQALFWASRNQAQTTGWFRQPEAARQIDADVVDQATAFDPQWTAPNVDAIRVAFSTAQMERLRGLAQFASEIGVTRAVASLERHVVNGPAQRVDAASAAFDPASVRVLRA